MPLKILHITPAYYPATYWGGPIYSVYGLCNALAEIPDLTIKVLTTDTAGPTRLESVAVTGFPMRYPEGYDVFFCRRRWAASVSPGMLLHLWPMVRWADVVHLTAVYSPPTIPTLLACRALRKPLVWSPRGALQNWQGARRRRLKALWELICSSILDRERSVLHVTSEAEARASAIRLSRVSISVIPNGVEVAEVGEERVWKPDGTLRLLYVGRLHRIKGLENLLEALAQLHHEDVNLVVCGDGEPSYVAGLKQLSANLALGDRVTFRGHVEGAQKTAAFRNADVCVIPSLTESFGMVVAEALGHGVPVIASKGTPWKEIVPRGCGDWVDNAPETLAAAIRDIRWRNLAEMGEAGRRWMQSDYSWRVVAREMFGLYETVRAGK